MAINCQSNIKFHCLGRLPLNVKIRENADAGTPSVIAGDAAAESYMIAQKIAEKIA